MALYSVLDIKQIEELTASFQIDAITSFKVLHGGSENTNYRVNTTIGSYVLTICEQKTQREANQLALLLEYLELEGFRTSRIIRSTTKELLTFWEDKPVMLKEYIDGIIMEEMTPAVLKLVGIELGRLHKISAPPYLPITVGYGLESFQQIEKYANGSSFQQWLLDIERYINEYLTSDMPKVLAHSDLFYNNVVVSSTENRVTIMDFEEATHYYRVFDLGMTIVGSCQIKGVIDLKSAESFLRGYLKEVTLTEKELNGLKAFTVYAAAATSFWRHKQYHYTAPDPSMSNHYLKMKELADAIMALPDDCFSKAL